MTDMLTGLAIGAVVAALAAWAMRRSGGAGGTTEIHHSLTRLRAVGELVVFKLVTQQIVTSEEHAAGRWKDYFKWLLSPKKLAIIIEYGIDFKYDLRDPAFTIDEQDPGRFALKLPPCLYQLYIRDIKLYDEQNSRLLPWLLGDLTEVFGPGFDETAKNKLLEAARDEAEQKAQLMVTQLRSEAQSSARQTLDAMARGFGAENITVEFADAQPEAQPIKQAPALSDSTESS